MEPIRILHVVPNMQAGGLESFVMSIYRNIDRNKVQFDFLYHYEGEYFFDDEIRQMGGQIYNLTVRQDNDLRKYIRDLNSFFRKHKEYKVIHSHMPSLGFIHLNVAKKQGVSVRIIHSHNSSFEKTFKGFIKSILGQFSVKYANYRFACSIDAGKYLYHNKEFTVINNAIDVSKFLFDSNIRNQMRDKMNLNDKFVIGHVGRFVLQKNHSFLLDVFVKILEKKPNSVLLLVGDGDIKSKIENKVNELGIEKNVIFYGTSNEVQKLFQVMDVFILPSLFEGLGIVLIEAQAAGLKCFTSADVVPEEAHVSKNLEYIPLDESEIYWANKILKYDNYYERKDMYKDICEHKYDIESVSNKLQEFYINKFRHNQKNDKFIC